MKFWILLVIIVLLISNTWEAHAQTNLDSGLVAYTVEWDASGFASGVYYYKLNVGESPARTGEYLQVKKMILIK